MIKSQIVYIILNPDGTYAGEPTDSYEEARELVNAKEHRKAFAIDIWKDEILML